MKRITVFCGSSPGTERIYAEQAYLVGQSIAKKQIGLVYGGAKVGLMGAVADGVLSVGGEVIGVLPNFLKGKEIAHTTLTELILVETMHERKMKMHEISDGVIALPGGFGTLEELFEMLTWAQLGLHTNPIGLLNIEKFFDPMVSLMQGMVEKGFLKEINQKMLLIGSEIDDLLNQLESYKAPMVEKWITNDKT